MLKKDDLVNIAAEIFNSYGIDLHDQQSIAEMDSLQYISILVEFEDKLEIVFPDALLINNIFVNMDDFYEMLVLLLGDKCG